MKPESQPCAWTRPDGEACSNRARWRVLSGGFQFVVCDECLQEIRRRTTDLRAERLDRRQPALAAKLHPAK